MSREKIVPAWTYNLGRLIQEGAEVVAQCSRCNEGAPVDLVKMAAAKGLLLSLWNRHPPCPRRCGERVTFVARRPDAGWWHVMMKTEDPTATAHLHRIYEADRKAAKDDDAAWRWLRKRQLARRETRFKARTLVERYGPQAIAEAETSLHMPGLREMDFARAVAIYREVRRRTLIPAPNLEETL